MSQLIQSIERNQIKKMDSLNKYNNFKVGDDIIVNLKKEESSRIQTIIGRCIGITKRKSTSSMVKMFVTDNTKTKTIFLFPLYSPYVSFSVKTNGHTRRAKQNYLITNKKEKGKHLRIKLKKNIKLKKTKN